MDIDEKNRIEKDLNFLRVIYYNTHHITDLKKIQFTLIESKRRRRNLTPQKSDLPIYTMILDNESFKFYAEYNRKTNGLDLLVDIMFNIIRMDQNIMLDLSEDVNSMYGLYFINKFLAYYDTIDFLYKHKEWFANQGYDVDSNCMLNNKMKGKPLEMIMAKSLIHGIPFSNQEMLELRERCQELIKRRNDIDFDLCMCTTFDLPDDYIELVDHIINAPTQEGSLV